MGGLGKRVSSWFGRPQTQRSAIASPSVPHLPTTPSQWGVFHSYASVPDLGKPPAFIPSLETTTEADSTVSADSTDITIRPRSRKDTWSRQKLDKKTLKKKPKHNTSTHSDDLKMQKVQSLSADIEESSSTSDIEFTQTMSEIEPSNSAITVHPPNYPTDVAAITTSSFSGFHSSNNPNGDSNPTTPVSGSSVADSSTNSRAQSRSGSCAPSQSHPSGSTANSRPPSRSRYDSPKVGTAGGWSAYAPPPMPSLPPPSVPIGYAFSPDIPRIETTSNRASFIPTNSLPFPVMAYDNQDMTRSLNSLPDLQVLNGYRSSPSSRRNSHMRATNRISSLTLQVPGAMSPANADSANNVRSARSKSQRRSWIGSVLGRSKDKEIPEMPSLPDCWELQADMVEFPAIDKNKKITKGSLGTGLSGMPYDIERIVDGQLAAELWINGGNTDIHLFPGSRAVFRVPSHIFSSSTVLTESAAPGGGDDRSAPWVLLMPLGTTDGEASSSVKLRVLAARNLFAFLLGKPLVATSECSTALSVLAAVADLLSALEFGDGTDSFGPVAATAFDQTIADLGLADIRGSPRRIVDALVLAERFKSTSLYAEAFAHAVGMHLTIDNTPALAAVAPPTRILLERGLFDLEVKENILAEKFRDCGFTALFGGAMTTKASAGKLVSYPAWHAAFGEMRLFVLGFVKTRYGSWPPPKRQDLPVVTRLQARHLYADFASLYDLLVDRNHKTTRKEGDVIERIDASSASESPTDRILMGIRRVLGEYDESAPPVLPAMPYDVPRLPELPDSASGGAKSATSRLAILRVKPVDKRKLQKTALPDILSASHNADAIKDAPEGSLLHAFIHFEARAAHNKSIYDLIQMRCGFWLFIYAALQSLPLVVVDAPGVRFSGGVDYYLCQTAPLTNPANPDPPALSAVDTSTSVESVMQRSHAWARGREWSIGRAPATADPTIGTIASPAQLFDVYPTTLNSIPANQVGGSGAQFFIASSDATSRSSDSSPVQYAETVSDDGDARATTRSNRSDSARSGGSGASTTTSVVPSIEVEQVSYADDLIESPAAVGRRMSVVDENGIMTPRHQHPLPIPTYLQQKSPQHPMTLPPSPPHRMSPSSVLTESPRPVVKAIPMRSGGFNTVPFEKPGMNAGQLGMSGSSFASASTPQLFTGPLTPVMTPVSSMTGLSKYGRVTSARFSGSTPGGPSRRMSMTFDDILADSGSAVAVDSSAENSKPANTESTTRPGDKRRSWWIGSN